MQAKLAKDLGFEWVDCEPLGSGDTHREESQPTDLLWEKRAELRAYARALGRAISETCALLSFKRPRRSHTAPSPNSESLMMTPLGVQAAASAQLCSCARYDMMPPRPVKLGVWPFISFDLGSWHHDKHAFSVQGRISPNVPTRRAWLHLTEACSSSSWPRNLQKWDRKYWSLQFCHWSHIS